MKGAITEFRKNPLFYCFVIGLVIAVMVVAMKLHHDHPNGAESRPLIVPELWIDPETQCNYFVVPGGIAPRLGTDGFPLCYNTIIEGH